MALQVYTEEDVVHAAEAARELEEPTGAGIVYKGDRELDRMLEATASMAASIGTVVLSSMNPQDALVARHGPGEFVGEMAVMSPGMVRTASGRARTCVRAVCIRREEMQRLFELRPDLQGQLKETIAARRATRELVAAYQALGQIHQDIEEEKLQRRVTAGREMVQSYYQSAAAKKVSTVMASRDAVFVPAMQKLLPGQSAQGIRRQVTAPVTRPGPLHQASLPQDVLCSDLTKASSLGPQARDVACTHVSRASSYPSKQDLQRPRLQPTLAVLRGRCVRGHDGGARGGCAGGLPDAAAEAALPGASVQQPNAQDGRERRRARQVAVPTAARACHQPCLGRASQGARPE